MPPPPSASVAAPNAPTMSCSLNIDPACRPRTSHKMVVATPALEYILRQHAVTLTAIDRMHATNPMVVGEAIKVQLSTPPHLLRVTVHHTEAFLGHFDQLAHRDNVVHRGMLNIDGAKYFIRSWNTDDQPPSSSSCCTSTSWCKTYRCSFGAYREPTTCSVTSVASTTLTAAPISAATSKPSLALSGHGRTSTS
ncbi:hypothetical protein D1007_45222 [Hordeum vulgare]|nr:hypothetical protein D1007_45222 [Hordeum vulgare]